MKLTNQKSVGSIVKEGIFTENPIFVGFLGMCPTLAVTKSLSSAIGMAIVTLIVLFITNTIISAIKGVVPKEIRIPIYIVVIATVVKAMELLLQAYVPSLFSSLGIFLPLIVVNCIVLGRAEAFASKNNLVSSIIDGLGMGLGFSFALTLLGVFLNYVQI